MKLVELLFDQWKSRGCGLTVDIVGDAQISSEFQWVIAIPVDTRFVNDGLNAVESLRSELTSNGLHIVPSEHHDPAAKLPNGIALEPTCPYRPDTCVGEHIIATGHGLLSEFEAMGLRTAAQAKRSKK